MFGIGLAEIFTILIVAVVLINPKSIPGLFSKLGRFYGQLKGLRRALSYQLKSVERELERETHPDQPSPLKGKTTAAHSQTKEEKENI